MQRERTEVQKNRVSIQFSVSIPTIQNISELRFFLMHCLLSLPRRFAAGCGQTPKMYIQSQIKPLMSSFFHSEETCGNPQLEVSHSYNPVTGKCMIVSPAVLLIQLTYILGCANSKDVIYIHYISQQTADNLAGQELVATSWCNDVAHQLVYSHLSPLLRLT